MGHPRKCVSDGGAGGHGRGAGALILEQKRKSWDSLEVLWSRDDITAPTEWHVSEARHTFVVHLGGRMDELETELDGHGGSRGSALPGEIWSIPAGMRYASRAVGGSIAYAVFFLDPGEEGECAGAREIQAVAGKHDAFLHQAALRSHLLATEGDDVSHMQTRLLGPVIARHLRNAYGLARKKQTPPTVRPLSRETARRLRDYVHDNLADAIALESLASVAGMSSHNLLEAFRPAFGVTPWQYVIRQRLRQAQRLLSHPRRDITNVALECGFSSHSHLATAFKKHVGRTPSEFRRDAISP